MKNIDRLLKIILIFLLVFFTSAIAQHADKDNHAAGKEDKEGHSHMNHIALFGGATINLEKTGTYFSLGADYVRVITSDRQWAVSFFGEAIFAEHAEWLFGVPLYYRIKNDFWFRTGPGVEFVQEKKNDHDHHRTETEAEFLYRIGLYYIFHWGNYGISPSLDLDLVRNHTSLVWGLNIGIGF